MRCFPPLTPGAAPPQDSQTLTDISNWLSFHRVWGKLGQGSITALAASLQLLKVEAGTEIYPEGAIPQGIYLLKWGTVEIYRLSELGRIHITYRNAGDIFGYVPLVREEDQSGYSASAIAITKSEIWFLGREEFAELKTNHPDFQAAINHLLAIDLARFSQHLSKERERLQGLQPYLQPIPKDEAIIGFSKASQKLRQQVQQGAADLKPIILLAPPGSGKTFIASLIHRHSGLQDRPFAEVDLAQLPRLESGGVNTNALFGEAGGQLGAIALLERGTLLLDNVQLLNPSERDRLAHFLKTGEILPLGDTKGDSPKNPPSSWVRLILASPQPFSLPGVEAHTIKLFSLPQRKQDIPEFARYFLSQFCQERGRSPLQINQANLRRLLSYDYPDNLAELAAILKRATIMTPPEQTEIPEQVLWSVQSPKNAFRVDLLNQIPWLRRFLLSDWWPERFWVPMMLIFIPVTLWGFIGPQGRDSSITLHLFWAWWWPFYLLLFPLIGRLWCAVCPFMIAAEWLRNLSLWLFPRQLLPWPAQWLNRWGAWFLWTGFVAIYLWEKLWDLPHTAYLSSWLLLTITTGAVIFSLIYERRLWCRYLCPIGGMNGMFAKLAAVELRSTQQVCGSQCSTFGCYKGSGATPPNFSNPLPTEGQATGGCPLYSHPAQLQDNRDCILCMTCLKACPNRSAHLNFRFPAVDLLENHQGFWAEIALLLLLLAGPFLHHSQRILGWVGQENLPLDAEHLLTSIPVVGLLLSIPWLMTYLAHQLARSFDSQMPKYKEVIYAYLPMTLAANLVYYIPAMVTEAGNLLPVIARTLGYGGVGLPTLTWSGDVAAFLQGFTLLSIFAFSLFPLAKISERPLLNNWPHITLMAAFIAIFWQLMV